MPRILVLDDDEGARLALKVQLEGLGFDTEIAGIEPTLGEMPYFPPAQAALVDLNPPKWNGFEALRTLHVRFPRMPIAVLADSRGPSNAYVEVSRRMGAAAVLVKPIAPIDLLRTLVDVLADGHRACGG
jgi:CheY-like chemotaxis protein